jgi:hypothetical protein
VRAIGDGVRRMTRSRVTAAVAAALCLAAALSGCAASSTPLPPDPTEAEIDAIMAEEVERQVKTNAVSFPEVWEAVEFERFVSSEEMPVVLDECFTGFGAEGIGVFSADGSYSMGTGVMGEFESVVMNACTLAYPDEYQKPLVQTDEQLEYSYNYNVSFVVPCLRAAGYAVESPPSREEYRDFGVRERPSMVELSVRCTRTDGGPAAASRALSAVSRRHGAVQLALR